VGDIEETLNGLDQRFDLCMSADVFPYVGDLQAIFKMVKKCLTPNGSFLFLTEHTIDSGFILQASGRYAHSESYIRQLSAERGFEVKQVEKVVFRFDQGKEVIGNVFLECHHSSGS